MRRNKLHLSSFWINGLTLFTALACDTPPLPGLPHCSDDQLKDAIQEVFIVRSRLELGSLIGKGNLMLIADLNLSFSLQEISNRSLRSNKRRNCINFVLLFNKSKAPTCLSLNWTCHHRLQREIISPSHELIRMSWLLRFLLSYSLVRKTCPNGSDMMKTNCLIWKIRQIVAESPVSKIDGA